MVPSRSVVSGRIQIRGPRPPRAVPGAVGGDLAALVDGSGGDDGGSVASGSTTTESDESSEWSSGEDSHEGYSTESD